MRRSLALLIALAAALVQGTAAAETNTPVPVISPKVDRPKDDPTPAAVDTYAVPAPSAAPGSATFAKVPNEQCTDIVAQKSMQIYSKNRPLFDQCVIEGKYQIFPYGGKMPTQEQIDSMARSPSCRSVFTACVLANLPQCDIGGLALKSVTETFLKVAVDVETGLKAPGTDKFFELVLWRRDVNLAQAKGLPYDKDSQLYTEFSRNLWRALTRTDVQVLEDLTISLDGNGTDADLVKGRVFANVTSGSDARDIVGRVTAAGSTSGSVIGGSPINLPPKGKSAAPSERLQRQHQGLVVALGTLLVVGFW